MSKIKDFIIETLLYGFANVFSRFFAMLLIPIFTSYLSKEDYANFAMLQSTFSLLTFFLALNAGVFFYYYEYEKIKYRKIVFSSWFYYQLFMAIVIIFVLFFTAPYLVQLFITTQNNYEIIRWCLVLIGVQLIPYIFNITNINLYRINRSPRKVIWIVFFESLLTLLFVYIFFKYFNSGLLGVVVAQIIGRSVVAVMFYKTASFYINIFYFSRKLLKKIFYYSWPFIVSSTFSILIVSADKFIGAEVFADKESVAVLALSSQLVLPVVILADMIRMAIGPYVMSIRKEDNADDTYQRIFELIVLSGALVLIGVVLISPFLTLILTDDSFLPVVELIPLLALANVLSLVFVQFSVSFNLVKKNIYIMYAFILGSLLGVIVNLLFMKSEGFVVAGYSQIVSYLFMCFFLYYYGRKVSNLNIQLKNSFVLLSVITLYIVYINYTVKEIYNKDYFPLIASSFICGLFIIYIYCKQQKISFKNIKQLLKK